MQPFLKDAAGLGALLWLIGYLASLVLYFSPFATSMGWIILAIFTPFTIIVTWVWFRKRALTLRYYAGVGVAWMAIAIILDYLFIVRLFGAITYYGLDVLLYYALTFLIPVGVGVFLNRAGQVTPPG
jgi:hypothetical protein